jgi:Uncharacterized protein conserved in bacteria
MKASFKNDLYEGKGILRFADGNVYEGEFKKDLFEGKGIYKFAIGSVYEGEFKKNKKKEKEF